MSAYGARRTLPTAGGEEAHLNRLTHCGSVEGHENYANRRKQRKAQPQLGLRL